MSLKYEPSSEQVSRCTRVSTFSVVRSILDEPPEPPPESKGWQVVFPS